MCDSTHAQGSSVPVNIPMGAAMRARGMGAAAGEQGVGGQQEASATFIPPHQFSQRDDFTMGSFVPGETPGEARGERLLGSHLHLFGRVGI
jgi:hypothetical protein